MKKTEKEQPNDNRALKDMERENLRSREWSSVKCHREWKWELTRDIRGKDH